MKHIIITGASGLVATELTAALLSQSDDHLYLLSTHVDNISERYKDYKDRVGCFTLQSFAEFVKASDVKYNYCIHTAFARSSNGNSIVESIDYQRELIALLKKENIGVFVNISSQSVYGKSSEPLWTEDTPLDPDYLYAMGKYFSEVITQQMFEGTDVKWTNIRLCSVCEKARFIRIFVQNAINGVPITLTAPDQQASFIEVQDVANALVQLIRRAENITLAPVYNLGANIVHTVAEMAEKVRAIAIQQYGIKNVNIVERPSDNHIRIGMDSSFFMRTFHWTPQYSMDDMIVEMFEMLINPNGVRYPVSFKIVYQL